MLQALFEKKYKSLAFIRKTNYVCNWKTKARKKMSYTLASTIGTAERLEQHSDGS